MSTEPFFSHALTAKEVRSKSDLIGKFTTSVNHTYSVWIMEKDQGNEILVLIQENENQVAGVMDAITGKFLYLHPRSIDGALKLLNI